MFLSRLLTALSSKTHLGASLASLTLAVTLTTAGCAALTARLALATDLDYTQSTGGQQDDGNFLRIGIGKSAVIKLPAAAKDVIVGDPTVVDVVLRNRNTAYLFARSPAQTNVFFFDAAGNQILNLDLEVAVDSKAIKKLIDRTIPGNAIQVDGTGKNIVLKGTAANAQEAKLAEDLAEKSLNLAQCDCKVVNAMTIAEGDQVMLKVRVVELKRSVLKQLGVNLDAQFSVGNFDFGFNSSPAGPGGILNAVGSFASGGFSADVRLKALESEGLATTLAEPTLTAVSGASASFHAGGQYPYQVCTGNSGGNGCTPSVEFKDYGVALSFTPTVLTEGRIALKIRTEVSELGPTLNGYPTIDTRNAETAVEISSGGSMMLAGLIKDVTSQDLQGTPGLRKLPILGSLFSSRTYQRNQSEMVVIVTPYIVNPTKESALATPVDGFNAATDRQAILFGRLNKVYGTPGKHPNGVYHGKVGYIIE